MTMDLLLKVAGLFALSMVKYPFSQGAALGMGFSFLPSLLITTAGGCTGVLVFYRLSGALMEWAARRKAERRAKGLSPKRVFTRTNRTIVRVKSAQGLSGLAFLTPILISIPLGSVLAAKYFRHDRRTLPVLLLSVCAWGLVLNGFWQLFP